MHSGGSPKSLKKKRTVLKEVTASPSQLFEHYKSFFMDEQSDLTDKQQNLSNQVNDFFNVYTKPLNFQFFTFSRSDNRAKLYENCRNFFISLVYSVLLHRSQL